MNARTRAPARPPSPPPPQLPTNAAEWPPVVYADRNTSVESLMRRSVEVARQKYGPKPLQLILVLLPTKVRGVVCW